MKVKMFSNECRQLKRKLNSTPQHADLQHVSSNYSDRFHTPDSSIASSKVMCDKMNGIDFLTTRHSGAVSPRSTENRFETKEQLTITSSKVLSQR